MNNPSSMFGHTFLRFDRAEQDERTRLLSYAVNYGAAVDDDNGLRFAIYGLTGGYPGTYSVMPYHQLVRKYSDYENRDIWEYQLNLTSAEVRRLLEHLWELQSNYADYYFFDENCSYQLLFLLDVARPGLALTDRFEVYAIPVDTVRAVVDRPGLLGGTVFRASSRTRIEQRLRTLDPPERELVNRLADGELAPDATELQALPAPRRAAVLELAADFVTYRLRTGEQARDEAAALAWRLLAARSQITAAIAIAAVPEPSVRPDQGHESARAALGIGARDGRLFQSLRLRPGYHQLLDPEAGYLRGAEIDFLDLELRRYAGELCADPQLADRGRHPLAVAAQRAVQAALVASRRRARALSVRPGGREGRAGRGALGRRRPHRGSGAGRARQPDARGGARRRHRLPGQLLRRARPRAHPGLAGDRALDIPARRRRADDHERSCRARL